MAEGPTYKMPLKRRKDGKTDYRQRLRLLKSRKIRSVVRPSNNNVRVQFIRYKPEGDEVEVAVTAEHIQDIGWKGSKKNIPSSYLVGYLAGKKALDRGIDEAVLDIGFSHPESGGRIFATLQGMIDAGVHIPHDLEILPPEGRIKGEHIGEETVDNFEEVKSKLEES